MREIDFGKGAMMNLTRLKEQDYDLVLTTNETLNFISDLEGFLIDEMQEFSAPKGFYWNEFVKKKYIIINYKKIHVINKKALSQLLQKR